MENIRQLVVLFAIAILIFLQVAPCRSELWLSESPSGQPAKRGGPQQPTQIISVVTAYRKQQHLSTHRIVELHSGSQSRSLLKFRQTTKNGESDSGSTSDMLRLEAGTLWIDTKLDLILSFNDGSGRCRRLTRSELIGGAYGQLLRLELNLASSKVPTFVQPEGPSRWLHFVSSNWELLEGESIGAQMIRNTKCHIYKLNVNVGAEILVFLDQQELTADGISQQANLMRITILAGEKYSIIDYLNVGPYRTVMTADTDFKPDPLLLDPFGGCLDLLYEGQASNMAKDIFGAPTSLIGSSILQRFAFRANVELSEETSQSVLSYQTSVAYDENSKLMRIDISPSSGDVAAWRQLVNFRQKTHVGCLQLNTRSTPECNPRPNSLQTKCMLTDIPSTRENGIELDSSSRLLTGSEQFVYLGLAKVRQLRAQVFASSKADIPYWLEPSLLISHNDGSMFAWNPIKEARFVSLDDKLVTVLYVSLPIEQKRPVLLALDQYRTDSSYKLMKEKRSVTFHDFSWSLSSHQINSLFSFDHEADSQDQIRAHAQVHLLLDAGSKLSQRQLGELGQMSVLERGLSLLGALQLHLKAPASSISDLRSRLVVGHNQVGQREASTKIVVSFNYDEIAIDRLSLRRLGRGTRAHSKGHFSKVSSLAECTSRANQMQSKPVRLGFDARKRICVIERRDSSESSEGFRMLAEQGLGLPSAGVLQIFELSQSGRDEQASSVLRDWKKLSSLELTSQADKIGFDDNLPRQLILSTGTLMASFQLRRIHLNNVVSVSNEKQISSSSGLIKGFALLPGSPTSERIDQVPLHSSFLDPLGTNSSLGEVDSEISEMSIDLCRSICSTDLNCGAYSVCLESGQLECVLTRASFESISQQLIEAPLSKKVIELQVAEYGNDERRLKLQLAKHADCAIYDKSYLGDYFDLKRVRERRLVDRVVVQSRDAEQCASWCANMNFRAMKNHLSRSADTLVGLMAMGQATMDNDLSESARIDIQSSQMLANYSVLLCNRFEFVNGEDLEAQPKELVDSLVNSASQDRKLFSGLLSGATNTNPGGFCLLPGVALRYHENLAHKPESDFGRILKLDGGPEFSFLEANFEVENFYEQQLGLSLKASQVPESLERIFERVQSGVLKLEAKELSLMVDFIKSGANQQFKLLLGAHACARRCFWNSGGIESPWPNCKSFDVILEWDSARLGAEARVWCQLNSVTLNQIISRDQLDLIETSKNVPNSPEIILDRRHFEPRPGLILELSFLKAEEDISSAWKLIHNINAATSFGLVVVLYCSLVPIIAIGAFWLGSDSAAYYLRVCSQQAQTRSQSVHNLTDWHRRNSSNDFQSDAETLHSINFNSVINHS